MATSKFSIWQCMQRSDSGWHEWFAWYPIKYKGETVWFKKIWRRVTIIYADGLGDARWVEYTTLGDYLASK